MENIEYLKQEYRTVKTEKKKAEIGLSIIKILFNNLEKEEGEFYLNEVLSLAKKHELTEISFGVFSAYAHINAINGELDIAQNLCKQALIYAEISENNYNIATAFNNCGIVAMEQGYFQEAIAFYKKSINICITHKYTERLISLYINIGNLMKALGNDELAVDYYKKGLKSECLPSQKAELYLNISISFLEQNNFTLATGYNKRAYNLYEKQNIIDGKIASLMTFCIIETLQERWVKAEKYAYETIALCLSNEILDMYQAAICYLAIIYMKTNNEKASEYIEKALLLSEEYQNYIWDCSKEFYEAYIQYLTEAKNFEKALFFNNKLNKYLTNKHENQKNILKYLSKTLLVTSFHNSKNAELPNIPRGIKINISQKNIFIAFEDIIYIEVNRHYLFFNKVYGERVKLNGQLKDVINKLDDRFIQCSRSFIINMNFIKSISNKQIELNNGVIVPCTKKMIDLQKIYYGWVY